jgi:predicted alpha/beta-hydrolase family hydrolase
MLIDTPSGPARVHMRRAEGEAAALVLGHGAGGGVEAPDLAAAAEAASSVGFSVALVEQPYRVAGRRSPASATRLDGVWVAVLEQLRADQLAGLQLVGQRLLRGAIGRCRG